MSARPIKHFIIIQATDHTIQRVHRKCATLLSTVTLSIRSQLLYFLCHSERCLRRCQLGHCDAQYSGFGFGQTRDETYSACYGVGVHKRKCGIFERPPINSRDLQQQLEEHCIVRRRRRRLLVGCSTSLYRSNERLD